jgi:hypothetical protein
MSLLGLSHVVETGFSLRPELAEGTLTVHFSGNADMAAVEKLSAYLKEVHREAIGLAATEVSFDFRDLYFMNSSCLKAFVNLIDTVSREEQCRYRLRFLANAKLHWQRRSLEALRRLGPDLVTVEN